MSESVGNVLIHSLKEVVCICTDRRLKWPGAISDIYVLRKSPDSTGCSVAADKNGKILAIETDESFMKKYGSLKFRSVISGRGKILLPGFIDAHSHPVWSGDRVHEFSMKLAGATYMDIINSGGGIHFTSACTKRESEADLLKLLDQRLNQMLRNGTTFVECKSGYGLPFDWETERKMLSVLNQRSHYTSASSDSQHTQTNHVGVELSITYCGAHAVPPGRSVDESTEDIIMNQLPKLKAEVEAGTLKVDNIDVFCETGVFTIDHSRRILLAGRDLLGAKINFHADELTALGGAEMGASIGATAISHLEYISEKGIAAMAMEGTVAVLLPTTAFMMRLPNPPARALLTAGVAVALGTDFNPNAYCLSMPIVMHLACVMFKMTLEEALVAATLNAAASIGKSELYGSLEVGKMADMLLLDAPKWEHLIYQFGCTSELLVTVFKMGSPVYVRIGCESQLLSTDSAWAAFAVNE